MKGFYDFSITQPASDTDAEFGVRLENDPSQDVTFDYATVDSEAGPFEEYGGDRTETATAGEDYTAVCCTLTFLAFTTNLTQTISIPILGDATVEPNKYFNIHLGKPTNAVIQPSTARIEIVNDDQETPPPLVNVNKGSGVVPTPVPLPCGVTVNPSKLMFNQNDW